MVGLGLFSTCLLMMVGIFPVASDAVAQSLEIMTATSLATQRLEQVRAMDYDAIVSGVSTSRVSCTFHGASFVRDYTVQTSVTTPRSGLKRVDVMVSWTGDVARYVRMELYVTRPY
jgi:hypothetical protein